MQRKSCVWWHKLQWDITELHTAQMASEGCPHTPCEPAHRTESSSMKSKSNMPKSWKTKGEKGGNCSCTSGRSNAEQQPLSVCKSIQTPPLRDLEGNSGNSIPPDQQKLFGVPKETSEKPGMLPIDFLSICFPALKSQHIKRLITEEE